MPTQSAWHYYSSVWFNSMCLPCFCFWHWCQKQIISHHTHIASQAHTHKIQWQNVVRQIHWTLITGTLLCFSYPASVLCYQHAPCTQCTLHTGTPPMTASKMHALFGFSQKLSFVLAVAFRFHHRHSNSSGQLDDKNHSTKAAYVKYCNLYSVTKRH